MDPRLEIASRLLGALVCQDRNRSLDERLGEVRHALALADLLLAEHRSGSAAATTSPTPHQLSAPQQPNEQISIRAAAARFHDRLERQRAHTDPGAPSRLH
jgi:hypothetical protein